MVKLQRTIVHSSYYNAGYRTFEFAKYLRKRSTYSEKILWQRLRGKNIKGVKFRRQHPVKYYIADFYCHEARLAIEVDGPIHRRKERHEYDLNRDAEFDRLGIMVLRFTHDEVKKHIGRVINTIRETLVQRLHKIQQLKPGE
ncbi:MAG TPA: endonuclease domain-containing protein [Bacteroidales bacterium]|nr:endonuclease domain-containing protein [Bacteroidales bacterium]